MSKIAQTLESHGRESEDFTTEATRLRDAYESYCREATNDVSPGTRSPASSQSGWSFLGLSKGVWIAIGIGLALMLLVVIGASGGSSDSSQAPSTPGAEAAQETQVPSENPVTPEPETSLDSGDSGFLNSCWRDDPDPMDSGEAESIRVAPIDCSDPQADWRVYKEARAEQSCQQDFISTTDGWILCIRAR